MRKLLILALVLAAEPARADMILSGAPAGGAVAVGKKLIAAMGGSAAWKRARYFRFDWISQSEGKAPTVRSHYWDRATGRYRGEGTAEEGAYRAYFNVNTKQGRVWLDGKKLTDAAEVEKWIARVYESFTRDSDWLLAPFLIFEPGVRLSWDDEAFGPKYEICDLLDLSYGPYKTLPWDRYSLYVDRKSHLLVEWSFDSDDKTHEQWSWSDWQKHGPILLASTRRNLRAPATIRFDKITVSETPDDAALTPPK